MPAGEEDVALLNAWLSLEEAIRREEFAALERMLVYCKFADGQLDERLLTLPDRAFARAARALYELQWIDMNA